MPVREQGGVPVEVQLQRPDYECVVQLGPQWRVRLADSLLEQLEDFSATNVTIKGVPFKV